ncbi:MAG: PD40 domain-containing protein [Anaerolineae bacterium]|nr:PD40 domain-containing protein [Anaerolineae bacterium]
MVAVLGASGSGKSSIVFAGLIPVLRREGNWLIADFRPGNNPILSLAGTLIPLLEPELGKTKLTGEARDLAVRLHEGRSPLSDYLDTIHQVWPNHHLLIIADQFEELYTLCQDTTTRQHFLGLLLATLDRPITDRSATHWVLTLRADFLAQASLYRPFADALQGKTELLGPMTRKEFTKAIIKPATLQGVIFEDKLVERLLDDVGEESGRLPLLQFALTELWQHQHQHTLTHIAYEAIGRVKGALSRHADRTYQSLSSTEQAQAKRILIQLVTPGIGTEDTRRLAYRRDLETHWPLVTRLASERLVVTNKNETGEETVEVVHEALLRHWEQLQTWLEADREFLTWKLSLQAYLKQWKDTDQDEGALLRGAPLVIAKEKLAARPDDLAPAEYDFIQASVALAERIASEQAAQQRRVILGIGIIALLIIVFLTFSLWITQKRAKEQTEAAETSRALRHAEELALGTATVALGQLQLRATDVANQASIARIAEAAAETRGQQAIEAQNEAQQQARIATARQLAVEAQILLEQNPQLALLLALEAQKMANGDERPRAIDQAPYFYSPLDTSFQGHTDIVNRVVWSPDGSQLASASDDKTIIIWEVATGQPNLVLKEHTDWVNSIAWNPDGTQLASASEDQTVIIWDIITGQPIATLNNHTDGVLSVSWSPDGSKVITGSRNGKIIIWDLTTEQAELTFQGHSDGITSVAWSPDGNQFASTSFDKTIIIWEASTGQSVMKLKSQAGEVFDAAWSPDGTQLASAVRNRTVIIWDVATGQIKNSLQGHRNTVWGVAWNPNGTQIASASADKTITVWDVASGEAILDLKGHSDIVWKVAWSPDGSKLASASSDQTIIIWDVATGHSSASLQGHTAEVIDIAWSPDSTKLASASDDHQVFVWDVAIGQPILILEGHTNLVNAVTWSPDGNMLASASDDQSVVIWNINTGQIITTLHGHTSWVVSLSWSPDGTQIASASADQTVIIWDVATGQIKNSLQGHRKIVWGVAWNPNGTQIASASADKTITVWDVASGEAITTLHHSDPINDLTWSPDGTQIAFASGRVIGIWNVKINYQPITRQKHTDGINEVAWSPDGTEIASASTDHTVIIWDTVNKKVITTLQKHNDAVLSVAWSPDGTQLASSSSDKTILLLKRRFILPPCQLVSRNLRYTGEWEEYLPINYRYQSTCPNHPLMPQSLVVAGRAQAGVGNIDEAMFQFRKAMDFDSNLEIDPLLESGKGMIEMGQTLAKKGDIRSAVANYEQALTLAPDLEISALAWNHLCWFGSLWQQAADVEWVCDQAVKLAPDKAFIRDSRGVNRALLGKFADAIKDFEFYVDKVGSAPSREAWIDALKAGENPFDESTLKRLLESSQ